MKLKDLDLKFLGLRHDVHDIRIDVQDLDSIAQKVCCFLCVSSTSLELKSFILNQDVVSWLISLFTILDFDEPPWIENQTAKFSCQHNNMEHADYFSIELFTRI